MALDRQFLEAVIRIRKPAPDAFYWCVFCGASCLLPTGRFTDGREMKDHLEGKCHKELVAGLNAQMAAER